MTAGVREPAARLSSAFRDGVTLGGRRWLVHRAWPADLAHPDRGIAVELKAADELDARRGIILDEDGVRVEDEPARTALRGAEAATVVSLRPGKRAVVRTREGWYVKTASPSATRRSMARADAVDAALAGRRHAPGRPRRRDAHPAAGVQVFDPAPGVTLRHLLIAGEPGSLDDAAEAVARSLHSLASVTPSEGCTLPDHDPTDEVDTMNRWVRAAQVAGPVSSHWRQTLGQAAAGVGKRLLADAERPVGSHPGRVLSHRDLHDAQLLLCCGTVTLLDWDTASWAPPALDLANLLAHCDHLVAVGGCRPASARRFERALLDELTGLGHPAVDAAQAETTLGIYRQAAAVRLRAVHAFRPQPGSHRSPTKR